MFKPSINLSTFTEIGTIVDIGPFEVRLLDTNYNGTGLKIWQSVEDLSHYDTKLGLPNRCNNGGFPTAQRMQDTLNELFETIPTSIREQIKEVKIPCYIPRQEKIEHYSTRLFLLSATEMCQTAPGLPREGWPLEFYIHNVPQWYGFHWLRTPALDHSRSWGSVDYDGSVGNDYTYNFGGVAPAFCTK